MAPQITRSTQVHNKRAAKGSSQSQTPTRVGQLRVKKRRSRVGKQTVLFPPILRTMAINITGCHASLNNPDKPLNCDLLLSFLSSQGVCLPTSLLAPKVTKISSQALFSLTNTSVKGKFGRAPLCPLRSLLIYKLNAFRPVIKHSINK